MSTCSSERKPSVVVVNLTSNDASNIIKSILNCEDLPVPTILEEDVPAYDWHIDTKYYHADVHICLLENKTIVSQEFAEAVGAVLLVFDGDKKNEIENLNSWLPFINEFSPEIKIILCEKCHEEPDRGVLKSEALGWCVDNMFELVEINPDESDDEEEDGDLANLKVSYGIPRVIQSLHAHLWPNLFLKEKPSMNISSAMMSQLRGELKAEQAASSESTNTGPEETSEPKFNNTLDMAECQRLSDLLDREIMDDEDMENLDEFGSLLSNLSDMRLQAMSLTDQDRKKMAENVVMQFWKAINGPEDELPSDDDMAS